MAIMAIRSLKLIGPYICYEYIMQDVFNTNRHPKEYGVSVCIPLLSINVS